MQDIALAVLCSISMVFTNSVLFFILVISEFVNTIEIEHSVVGGATSVVGYRDVVPLVEVPGHLANGHSPAKVTASEYHEELDRGVG